MFSTINAVTSIIAGYTNNRINRPIRVVLVGIAQIWAIPVVIALRAMFTVIIIILGFSVFNTNSTYYGHNIGMLSHKLCSILVKYAVFKHFANKIGPNKSH